MYCFEIYILYFPKRSFVKPCQYPLKVQCHEMFSPYYSLQLTHLGIWYMARLSVTPQSQTQWHQWHHVFGLSSVNSTKTEPDSHILPVALKYYKNLKQLGWIKIDFSSRIKGPNKFESWKRSIEILWSKEKTYWNLLTPRGVNDIVQIDEQEKNLCQKKTVFKNTLLHEKGTQIG